MKLDDCESATAARCIAALQARIEKLEAENAKMREALQEIAYNTSSSMPAEINDETSWYRGQFHSCIGRSARCLSALEAAEKDLEAP